MIGYIKIGNIKTVDSKITIFNEPSLAVHHDMLSRGKVYKIYYKKSDYEGDWRPKITLEKVKFIEEVDMEKYIEDNDRFDLLRYAEVSEKWLEKHINKITANPQLLYSMCKYKALSQDFISKYIDIIDFNRLNYTNLTEEFIDNNLWRLQCYGTLLKNMIFSEKFLDKHFDCFKDYLYDITNRYHLSDEFIDKHPEVLEKSNIYKQELSYDIIKKHKKHVQWYFYYMYQNLEYSEIEEFLRELINYFQEETDTSGEAIDKAMSHIYEYQNPPEDFYYSHKTLIRKDLLVSHIDEYSDDFIANNPEIVQFMDIEDDKTRRVLLILSSKRRKENDDNICYTMETINESWKETIEKLDNCQLDERLVSVGEWNFISSITDLDEDFIYKFIEYINLDILVKSHQLSDEFLMDYFILLDKSLVAQYQNLSEEFLDEYRLSLPVESLQLNTVIPTELKKKYIK